MSCWWGHLFGLTGTGGGILAVPALVVGLEWPMQRAAPIALIAVAGSAALGAIEAFWKGLVRYLAAALMALSGIPFTWLGFHCRMRRRTALWPRSSRR